MTLHHPAKFSGHRHYCSENMFSVVEEQDSTNQLKSTTTILPESIWYESTWHVIFSAGHTGLNQQQIFYHRKKLLLVRPETPTKRVKNRLLQNFFVLHTNAVKIWKNGFFVWKVVFKRVRINFSKLYHEKLYDENFLLLASPEGPLWLSVVGRIFCNCTCCRLLENAILSVD